MPVALCSARPGAADATPAELIARKLTARSRAGSQRLCCAPRVYSSPSVPLCPAKGSALTCPGITARCRRFACRNPQKERGCSTTAVLVVISPRALCHGARRALTLRYRLALSDSLSAGTLPTRWGDPSSCSTPETPRHTYWKGASPPPPARPALLKPRKGGWKITVRYSAACFRISCAKHNKQSPRCEASTVTQTAYVQHVSW